MKLIAYVLDGHELDIRPARPNRAWMDAYFERYAYGCLPLLMANMHGWEILSPVSFTAIWNGGANKDCVAILEDEDTNGVILSFFGAGIITYKVPAVFRTEPGYDLIIQAPPNNPVDGVSPLTGIVEMDWASTVVSMNWQLTRPNFAVRFRKGQPICQIVPVKRGELESFEPEKRKLSDDPELAEYMRQWGERRGVFQQALKDPDSPERRQKWPGNYRRGTDVFDERAAPGDHLTRLRLKPFEDPDVQPD
ncbi:DUF6065 family protein [Kaistia sp. UC242_56]|uniref:DUF6065 family protein n=1 Tax=Kaistia sp. UC242_56 TaxID=3374625 RepID=UPI0037B6494A